MKKIFCGGILLIVIMASAAAVADNTMALRIGSGEKSLERYVQYGYNAAILGDLTKLADFHALYPGAASGNETLRRSIDDERRKFAGASARAKKLGLAVCVMTDEVSLPIPIAEQLQPSGAKGKRKLNLDDPKFWEAYRAKYREVLSAYPQIAYVIVRTGENYSSSKDGYFGQMIRGAKFDDDYFRHMQRFIEETRKIVADEFGRTLIWRTWDLDGDGFHANPAVYDRVINGLTNRRGLVFSVKFTQTDFWRYNDFNPTIGRDGVAQIIEFQCAREYEGKGAYPDYVGPIHAEALRQAARLGARGVWIWDTGGGWGGPFLKNDRWVRLNIFATTRLVQDPQASPRALAQEWAAGEFGAEASTNMADLLILSGECVRKFRYIEAYAIQHKGWMPSLNLMRDDIIRGNVLKTLYQGSKDSLGRVFAEKQEAVSLAGQMRSLLEQSREPIVKARGRKVYEESLSSLTYMQDLALVMEHYVTGMFLYYHWKDTHDAAEAVRAREELQAWQRAWADYNTQVPQLPGAASLYRSQNSQAPETSAGAMADLCNAALMDLARSRAAR